MTVVIRHSSFVSGQWSVVEKETQDVQERIMMQQGVFAQDEIGLGRVTDSPAEAVDLIVRSLPPEVKTRLKPSEARM